MCESAAPAAYWHWRRRRQSQDWCCLCTLKAPDERYGGRVASTSQDILRVRTRGPLWRTTIRETYKIVGDGRCVNQYSSCSALASWPNLEIQLLFCKPLISLAPRRTDEGWVTACSLSSVRTGPMTAPLRMTRIIECSFPVHPSMVHHACWRAQRCAWVGGMLFVLETTVSITSPGAAADGTSSLHGAWADERAKKGGSEPLNLPMAPPFSRSKQARTQARLQAPVRSRC